MVKLEGKEALELHEALKQRNAERRAKALAEARAEAAGRGKQPFDLTALEQLCDTSSEGRVDPIDVRQDRYEHMYYVEYPDLMTLAELAKKIEEINKW